MARTSTATAVWQGTLKQGDGTFEAGSGAFGGAYSFSTRFADATGTNPEELIAAAHASCFSMALSADLERAGTPATRVTTTAHCTMETGEGGPHIATIRLETRGVVEGIDQAAFAAAAEGASQNCPVSKALKASVTIELDARLEG